MSANSSVKTTRRDKILSYVEEGCLTFGVLTGTIIGLHVAVSHLHTAVESTRVAYGILAGGHIGAMIGFTATYTIPILAKSIFTKDNQDLTIEDLLTTHQHKPSRMAGIATGVALSLGLTWGSVAPWAGSPINIAPVIQAGNDFYDAVTKPRNLDVAEAPNSKTVHIYAPGSVPFAVTYQSFSASSVQNSGNIPTSP